MNSDQERNQMYETFFEKIMRDLNDCMRSTNQIVEPDLSVISINILKGISKNYETIHSGLL